MRGDVMSEHKDDPRSGARQSDAAVRELRAERLKERIYLTFAALAVILALGGHPPGDAGDVALTLLVTISGTLLAIFVADLVSHMLVQQRAMNRVEVAHAVVTSFGALPAVTLPFAFLGAAGLGWWELATALQAAATALIAALVVIGWVAVRRTSMPWWSRLLALGAEALLGLAVVGLQALAHAG